MTRVQLLEARLAGAKWATLMGLAACLIVLVGLACVRAEAPTARVWGAAIETRFTLIFVVSIAGWPLFTWLSLRPPAAWRQAALPLAFLLTGLVMGAVQLTAASSAGLPLIARVLGSDLGRGSP